MKSYKSLKKMLIISFFCLQTPMMADSIKIHYIEEVKIGWIGTLVKTLKSDVFEFAGRTLMKKGKSDKKEESKENQSKGYFLVGISIVTLTWIIRIIFKNEEE